MDHKIHNDKTVSDEFSGDEKRLILIQASGPVVLTGGASKICGLKVLCENILNRKTRIGQIENSSSYFYCKPEFSTLLGMINLIKNQEYFDIFKSKNDNKLSIFIERLDKWIEESYVY